MREIGIEELKQLQMDILSAVQEFCLDRGIIFSISCGTLLGCIRHNGYIPWDDDIDIYLLRKDYNRLVKEFPDTLGGRYKFFTLERLKTWDTPFGKIFDVNTILKERENEPYEMGVNIDVFPIDAVPQDKLTWQKYDKQRRFWMNNYCMRKGGLNIGRYHKERSLLGNIYVTLGKIIIRCIPLRCLAWHMSSVAQKYNNQQSDYVFECVFGYFSRAPFKRSVFDNIVLTPFEDREYMAFANYDEYLTKTYGDWRTLPPIEKRITHHSFKAWWK